ncbi:MAG: patatin-like phospholipase family protein [Holosporaceae bacterium]|nr:MAG: patatin-like phospholipase family protein [Holosporaceae bacterium]
MFAKLSNTSFCPPLWEAARATSAAPLYFKPLNIVYKQYSYLLADGGVGINNPSLLGVLMAKKCFLRKKL